MVAVSGARGGGATVGGATVGGATNRAARSRWRPDGSSGSGRRSGRRRSSSRSRSRRRRRLRSRIPLSPRLPAPSSAETSQVKSTRVESSHVESSRVVSSRARVESSRAESSQVKPSAPQGLRAHAGRIGDPAQRTLRALRASACRRAAYTFSRYTVRAGLGSRDLYQCVDLEEWIMWICGSHAESDGKGFFRLFFGFFLKHRRHSLERCSALGRREAPK